MSTSLQLALKYLKLRRSAVSVITLISVLGVLLGVAVLIIVLAVMTGFTDLMKKKLIETQAHFQIRAHGNYAIGNAAPVLSEVLQCGAAAAPVVRNPVLVQYGHNGRSMLDVRSMVMGVREVDLEKRLNMKAALKKLSPGKKYYLFTYLCILGSFVVIGFYSVVCGWIIEYLYQAAKGGLIAATKALAQEVARKGVTVNAVAPGFVRTDMVEGLDETALKQDIPARRFGEPDEVAALVAFLASPDAAYITGECISINGGLYS